MLILEAQQQKWMKWEILNKETINWKRTQAHHDFNQSEPLSRQVYLETQPGAEISVYQCQKSSTTATPRTMTKIPSITNQEQTFEGGCY